LVELSHHIQSNTGSAGRRRKESNQSALIIHEIRNQKATLEVSLG